MKIVILLTVLSLLFIQLNAQASNLLAAYSLTPTDQANFLNAHNQVRQAYGLSLLTWDTGLASDSATYAAQCMDNPLTHSNANGAYGENLSFYSITPDQTTFPYKSCDYHVITGWYSEEKNWNCSTNVCDTSGGKMCGHLTQIIWSTTTTVGCGVAKCLIPSTGGTSKNWYTQNAVCRYKTAGNYVGQHPLGSASKCPKQPTTLGPLNPTAPQSPNPTPAPVAPVASPVKAPTTPTTTPVSPTKTPTAPTPVPVPVTPAPVPTAPIAPGKLWWSACISNYWPTDSTGKQYQQLTPCAWEPWKDSTSLKTWCCPDPTNEWANSWPVYNLGASNCPDGVAQTYALADDNASAPSGLSTNAWIGIGVAIAVVIIIIIVIIVIVQKKKSDERV